MSTNHIFLLLTLVLTVTSCIGEGGTARNNSSDLIAADENAEVVVIENNDNDEAGLAIRSESYIPTLLLDVGGNLNRSMRRLLRQNNLLQKHYQRVGCTMDTCKKEWVTYTAIQYPGDTVLQRWASNVVGHFYYDASRNLDIVVNGLKTEENGEGEMEVRNLGCEPYRGTLNDGGQAMFDYYKEYIWSIGKNREEEHGPEGRYGCIIYRCWQSKKVVSYFVAYSTDPKLGSTHYVTSFDRRSGKELSLTDILKEDYVAEFNDLVVEAARQRHFDLLRHNNEDLAIDKNVGDYSSVSTIDHVGFVEEGLAVSTEALPFDQWAYATHILIIPYEKLDNLLVGTYKK